MTKHPRQVKRTRARSSTSAQAKGQGQLRVIGGKWRGRKLGVADVTGLRPTGNRTRETLFNWLQGDIAGAYCLDLFAGSGSLGFESLSRHAAGVVFVEPSPLAQQALQDSCRLLDIELAHNSDPGKLNNQTTAQIYAGIAQDALPAWRKLNDKPAFDVVFIDPPFELACQWAILPMLVPELVSDNALIYIEAPVGQAVDEQMPTGCQLIREKRFGDVLASLLRFNRADLDQETDR